MRIRPSGFCQPAQAKPTSAIVLLSAALCLVGNLSYGQASEDQEFKQDQEAIAKTPRDPEKFTALGERLDGKWRGKDHKKHAALMLRLCEPITSGELNGNRGTARKYALAGLRARAAIPPELEAGLAEHVVTYTGPGEPSAPTGQQWAEQRREDARVRLQAWQRLVDELGPPLDPKDAPTMYVPYPRGVDLPAPGASPESIKDPQLRAEYEKAIAKNKQKEARFARYQELQRLLERFAPRAEKYIAGAYSRAPFDSKELEQLLQTYLKDKAARARILDVVKRKTGTQ